MSSTGRRASTMMMCTKYARVLGQHGIGCVAPLSTSSASAHSSSAEVKATTVLCVRKDGTTVVMADGQVTMGSEIVKPNVKKVRVIQPGVVGGFAGATADAFTLFERLEAKLEEHPGQLTRACVELAKAWRTDKFLRKLEATMIVADKDSSFQITGSGDVLEPHDGVIGIGSGGSYALAAARALVDVPGMSAYDIAKKAMTIAADTCVYTNHNFTHQIIGGDDATTKTDDKTVATSSSSPGDAGASSKKK
jgi:ATP-dependent HslUV protease subunit HslV